MNPNFLSNRRCFLTGAALTAGMYGLNLAAQPADTKTEKDPSVYVIGPHRVIALRSALSWRCSPTFKPR